MRMTEQIISSHEIALYGEDVCIPMIANLNSKFSLKKYIIRLGGKSIPRYIKDGKYK